MKNGPKARRAATQSLSSNNQLRTLAFVRAGLESVQTNIFVADRDFTIIFANERALKTLEGIEDEIRRAFNVTAKQIVGGSIHRFHKNPRAVEQILRNPPNLPHRADLTFRRTTIHTRIKGVCGPHR